MTKSVLPAIEKKLNSEYGQKTWKKHGTAVDVLISTILSQNTSDINSGRAFKSLKNTFSGWDDIANSSTLRIKKAIQSGGLAAMKAGYIKKALQKIRADNGSYSLQGIGNNDISKNLEYLTSFTGVGEKTAACVLLFAFGHKIMPVDTHIHRLSKRIGLVPDHYDLRKTFYFWFGQSVVVDYYNLHLNMVKHGRNVCVARKPKCDDCVIRALCSFFTNGDI